MFVSQEFLKTLSCQNLRAEQKILPTFQQDLSTSERSMEEILKTLISKNSIKVKMSHSKTL